MVWLDKAGKLTRKALLYIMGDAIKAIFLLYLSVVAIPNSHLSTPLFLLKFTLLVVCYQGFKLCSKKLFTSAE